MTFNLNAPMFKNEAAAIAHMEADRWPNGVTCPLCGADTVHKMGGETQAGMFACYACKGKFTVRTGTVFERSHIPLHKWLLATYLMGSSKKGISAHQLHRMLGITYKSAWFMAHRVREAMGPAKGEKMGGPGTIVEADETELGRSHKSRKPRGPFTRKDNKKFVALVERGGRVRSKVIDGSKHPIGAEIADALHYGMHPESVLHTDGAGHYKIIPYAHEAIDHNQGVRPHNGGRREGAYQFGGRLFFDL
jgi:transposase-like protein